MVDIVGLFAEQKLSSRYIPEKKTVGKETEIKQLGILGGGGVGIGRYGKCAVWGGRK